jgi:hypothetical protein
VVKIGYAFLAAIFFCNIAQAQVPGPDVRSGFVFYCSKCNTPLDDVICIGEAITSRAFAHDNRGDSAVGYSGAQCVFSADSKIGRQIGTVCPVRDMNGSVDGGPLCLLEATIERNGRVKRVIRVERLQPAETFARP